MKEMTDYLDTIGACKELGISIATLYRLLKKRKKNRHSYPSFRRGLAIHQRRTGRMDTGPALKNFAQNSMIDFEKKLDKRFDRYISI